MENDNVIIIMCDSKNDGDILEIIYRYDFDDNKIFNKTFNTILKYCIKNYLDFNLKAHNETNTYYHEYKIVCSPEEYDKICLLIIKNGIEFQIE